MAPLRVALVAADRQVWSGDASMVIARTIDGDIGVLPGHAPVLGVLDAGVVEVRREGEPALLAAVDGGFLSVADDQVSILAERADLPEDVDRDAAAQELTRAEQDGDAAAAQRARARVALAERAR